MNELWWSSSVDYFRKCNDITTPTPAIVTPADNRSSRRAKMTPRRRSGTDDQTAEVMPPTVASSKMTPRRRSGTDDQTAEVMPPTVAIMAQMTNMQLQINELHNYLKHLKPDGVCHIPIMNELPPTVTVLGQMAHMQRQINELHKYMKNLKPDGASEKNGGSSDTPGPSVDKVILLAILLI